ncbi:MAG: sodium-independent anion transporter [bacterium]
MGDKVFIKHLDGPLFFGFAARFQEMIQALPKIEAVVIRMDKVPYVDLSGIYAMEDAILELQKQQIRVVFTDIHGQPEMMLRKFDIIPDLVDEDHCFTTFHEAAVWLEKYCSLAPDSRNQVMEDTQ